MMTANSRPAPLQPGNAESPQRWWYARRSRLCCRDGHHFPNKQRFPESGFLRCEHWIDGEQRECGRWVFAYAIRGGGCIMVDVTVEEMNHLESLSTPGEVVEYLGIFDSSDAQAPRPTPRPPDRHHRRR